MTDNIKILGWLGIGLIGAFALPKLAGAMKGNGKPNNQKTKSTTPLQPNATFLERIMLNQPANLPPPTASTLTTGAGKMDPITALFSRGA